MMKGIWNNCFFCLTDLSKVTPRKSLNLPSQVTVLLKYILDVNTISTTTATTKYSQVITNIKQLIVSPTNNDNCGQDGKNLQLFCDHCVHQVETVFLLHQQLEVMQLKLVNALKSVKATVIKNSKCKAPKKKLNQLKKFEARLKENGEQENDPKVGEVEGGNLKEEERQQRLQQRKILDTLYAFQDGIIEKDKQSIDIPLVYLSKYSPKSTAPAPPTPTIKPEPSTLPALDPSDLIDFPPDDNYFLDNPPSPPSPPSPKPKPVSKKRKLGRPKKDPNAPKRKSSYIKKLVKLPTNPGKIGRPKTKPPPPPHDPSIIPRQKVRVKRLASFRVKPHSHKTNHRPRILLACDLCPFTTPTSYTFEHHLRSHEVPIQEDTKITLYTCDTCEDRPKFTVKQHYEFHMAAHQGHQTILCDVCNLMWNPITLEAHLKTHPEIEKIFCCKSCSFCCSSREAFIDHLKYHKSDNMECDICQKNFNGRRKLLKHYFDVHQVIDKIVCGIDGCTNAYLDKDSLTIHKRVHTVAWRCKVCGKGFSCNAALQMHLRTHTGDKPFQCDRCPEAFSMKSYLSRHMISKHDAPRYQCDFCEKGYTDQGSLRAHLVLHKGTGFVCDHCGKMFGSRTQLGRHLQSHAEERKFICDECGSGFKTKPSLITHVKTHGGEKKWKCGYCNRAFLFNKYLTQHLRIHTGERPYRCKNCDQGFTQAGPLKQHELNCHRIPAVPKYDRSSP